MYWVPLADPMPADVVVVLVGGLVLSAVATTSPRPPVDGGMSAMGRPTAGTISGDSPKLGMSESSIAIHTR